MEDVGQNYGYILYRNMSPSLAEVSDKRSHSYAQVYLDGTSWSSVDRLNQSSVRIKIDNKGARLDILVENTDRVNFGRQFGHGHRHHQGKCGSRAFRSRSGKTIRAMDDVTPLPFKSAACTGAYRSNL